jgi:hypothetical protein
MNVLFAFALLLAAPKAVPGEAEAANARDRAEAYYHFSLGLQSRFTGEAQEALAEYRRAQKLDPTSGEIRSEVVAISEETRR